MRTELRSYADPCGVARALDAVGERWALLVVRELSLGPRRFGQLRDGLPDISPNVLSQRLHDLEAADVVRRYPLDPPANTTVYELTGRGRELDPVLQALGRWGARQPPAGDREMSAASFLRSLRVLLSPTVRPDLDATYGLTVDGEHYRVHVADGAVEVERARAVQPLATLAGDVATLRRVLLAGARIADLERSGALHVSGDRRAARTLTTLFRARTG